MDPISTTVMTADEQALDARIYRSSNATMRGVVICAHAMMVDMRTFERSGFATALAERGFCNLLVQFPWQRHQCPSGVQLCSARGI